MLGLLTSQRLRDRPISTADELQPLKRACETVIGSIFHDSAAENCVARPATDTGQLITSWDTIFQDAYIPQHEA